MALPSLSGGSAAKVGDLYEQAWTVDSLLDVIAGKVTEIRLEPRGDDGLGVEFYRVLPDGTKEFHSVKRQALGPTSAWTPYQLTRADPPLGRSILGDLFGHLDADPRARAVFVSQDSAGEMREISERAKALSGVNEFHSALSREHRGSFEARVVPLTANYSDAHGKLRRSDFVALEHHQLVRSIENRIPALIRQASGEDADPAGVRLYLGDFAWGRLGADPIRREELVATLSNKGYIVHPVYHDPSVRERIRTLNGAFSNGVSRALVNGAHIPRQQAKNVADSLKDGGESILLSGHAGVGKTCVMAQVAEIFAEEKITHLAVSVDAREGALSSVDLGRKLGLPTSPTIVLGEMAQGERAVLCVDQVDALSFVGGRNPQGHQILEELVEEAKKYPNLRILLACRSFDIENDHILRGLVEGGARAARRIDIELLSRQDVQAVLSTAGVSLDTLNFVQIELLRTPIHLYLFLAGNRSPNAARSRRSLFNAYWDEMQRRVDSSVGAGRFQSAVKSLGDTLSERRQLQAPKIALDEHATALDAMASEGTVVVDGATVSFFHATFFDYAFARGFVGSQQDLVDWLLDDSQELFRRSQVRQVLEFLREGDVAAYLDILDRLLNNGKIRFHLKRLAIDWLGQLANPMPQEWQILEGLDGNLARHMLNTIYNKTPWFDLLNESGYLGEWTQLDSELHVQRAFVVCQGPEIFLLRSEFVANHFRRMIEGDGSYRQQIASRMTLGDVHHSRAMFDLFLEFVDDGTLDGQGGFGASGDWWAVLSKMSRENPAFCAEVIGHWFDRQEQLGPPATDLEQIGDAWWSNSSGEVIPKTVSAAPTEFAAQVLPRVAHTAKIIDGHQWEIPLAPVRQHLVEGLSDALGKLSKEDPDALDKLLASVSVDSPQLVERLKLRAWGANPDRYADEILGFLIDRQDLWRANEASWALAVAASLSSSDLGARLEDLIMKYRPTHESANRFGYTQFRLLSSFPSGSLSPEATRRLSELGRKFGEEAPTMQPFVPPTEVYRVQPRIPDEAIGRMDDEQLLNAMRKLHEAGPRLTGDSEWGEVEFARQLEQQAKIEPARFVRLVSELMPSELPPMFFAHILDGLLVVWPDAVSTADLLEVILRLHDLPQRPCGLSMCRAIREIAKEDLPESVLHALTFYAMEDPNPKRDWWLDDSAEGGDRNDAAIGAAINSVRGVAAQAVAALLFERPERFDLLKDAVESAVNDPTLTVRSVAPLSLLALLSSDQGKSVELFNALCADSGLILGTRYVEQYLSHFVFRSYETVRTILLAMVNSEDADSRRAAARLICVAALIDSESRELAELDAEEVKKGSPKLRQGAAEVYARNIGHDDVAKVCAEELRRFFNDPDDGVREAAVECFRHIQENELSTAGELIEAFIESDAFESQAFLLLYRLKEMTVPLPLSVLTIAERAVASWGPDASDIRTKASGDAFILSEIVVRLYEQTGDMATKEKILDVIDRMVELNFEGIAGGIADEDRV